MARPDLRQSAPRTRHIDRRKMGEFWYLQTEARKTPFNAEAAADSN